MLARQARWAGVVGDWPRRGLVAALRAYKVLISPALPPACRFTPTCSQYALEAIERYGALRGSWLALRRLARCHPFHPGGFDAVP
jgi:putative membrane protein insertion efficiency factor